MRFLSVFTLAFVICLNSLAAADFGDLKVYIKTRSGEPISQSSIGVKELERGLVANEDGVIEMHNLFPNHYKLLINVKNISIAKTGIEIRSGRVLVLEIKLIDTLRRGQDSVRALNINRCYNKIGTGVIRSFEHSELTGISAENIQQLPQYLRGGNDFRNPDTWAIKPMQTINDLDITNKHTTGVSGNYPLPAISSLERAQVNKGVFSAEYGDVMSEAENFYLKNGRIDKYEGFFRWGTGAPFLDGAMNRGVRVNVVEDWLELEKIDGSIDRVPSNYNVYEIGLGGPIPLLINSSFYLSGRSQTKEIGNSLEVIDPAGNNLGNLPDDDYWLRNLSGRLRLGLTPNLYLIVGGMYGLTDWENSHVNWLYADDEGIINGQSNGMPERTAKQNITNVTLDNFYVKLSSFLGEKSYYDITISRNELIYENGRRANYDDPSFFGGYELMEFTDWYKVEEQNFMNGNDAVIDQYQAIEQTRETADGQITMVVPVRNPVTGYVEGKPSSYGTDNGYGIGNTDFISHGSTGFDFKKNIYWEMKGQYSTIFDIANVRNNFAAGFRFRNYELHNHYNFSPYLDVNTSDVYTSEWQGGVYYQGNNNINDITAPKKPALINGFVEDRIEFYGFNIIPAIEIEYFNPKSAYNNTEDFKRISGNDDLPEVSAKVSVNPRLNINYNLLDNMMLSAGIGKFSKVHDFINIYRYNNQSYETDSLIFDTQGNPDQELQEVIKYNFTFLHKLTNSLEYDITGYYNNYYGLNPDYLYFNYSRYPGRYMPHDSYQSRGIEFKLHKRISSNFGFRFFYNLHNYEWQSHYTEDPEFDTRHWINFIFDLALNDDEGPVLFGQHILENMRLNFTTQWNTGAPYKNVTINRVMPITFSYGGKNRHPDYWVTNMRLSKGIMLKDIFGNYFGSSELVLMIDIYNLFNRTEALYHYPDNDKPYDEKLLDRDRINITDVTYYKSADFNNPKTINPDQYSIYGDRLYNANADFNNDDKVTPDERLRAYANYAEDQFRLHRNFRMPRSAIFSVMFRF